ncbi:MAG: hypothetical protein ACI4SD_04045 [Suilimivivens sp.]
MKRNKIRHFSAKKAVILAAACCLLVGTVSVAASGKIAYLASGFYFKDFESYKQLAQAEEKAGFSIKAVETFQNGYTFSGMDVSDTNAVDEEGNTIENYKEIGIRYKKAGADGLSLYAMEAVHDHEEDRRGADKTIGINGIEVKYYVDTYKWVPTDYEMTAEDEANMERGDYFISYGADEVSENQVSYVIWVQAGIRYSIMNTRSATSSDVLFEMAKELITQ